MVIMAIFKPNQSHLVDISIFGPWKGINNNNDNKKKETGEENVVGGRKKKPHLGKYFNCLLRFGAHHKRSICAPQSREKGVTQIVLRTKQWKPIHELGKVKPIYLTIYLLCVCLSDSVWVYRPGRVQMQLLLYMGGLYVCFWLCKLIYSTKVSKVLRGQNSLDSL